MNRYSLPSGERLQKGQTPATNCTLAAMKWARARSLMPEMAHSGEHHREACLISRSDYFVIAD